VVARWCRATVGMVPMTGTPRTLTESERGTLAAALDALLPPEGSFPRPSETDLIDAFILRRVPPAGTMPVPYPGFDADGLRATLAELAEADGAVAGLERLERERPATFTALWRLAVYGYYSRPETIAAIARDHAPAYHGAPQPLGYAHAIAPWDARDPQQLPVAPRGSYLPTDAVRRVDLAALPREEDR
jgi:hypothetical protein